MQVDYASGRAPACFCRVVPVLVVLRGDPLAMASNLQVLAMITRAQCQCFAKNLNDQFLGLILAELPEAASPSLGQGTEDLELLSGRN